MTGTLLLVPAPLDLGTDTTPLEDVLPHGVVERAALRRRWTHCATVGRWRLTAGRFCSPSRPRLRRGPPRRGC